jgi:16S rRNA processing protein RimM
VRDTRAPCRITGARRQGAAVLLSLAGCDTVDAASALVGRLLAVPEAEALPLPPGQFYPWQLEGCRVVTDDGREVGRVTRIERAGAQDLWVVSDGARERLIPAVAEIVLEVDVAGGRVVIRPPDGLLEL